MFSVDDPFLALILRFVVDTDGTSSTDQEFLHRQLKVMRQYLAQFPEEEHGSKAIEWIGRHASRYRRDWERNTVASRTMYLRCSDCPLEGFGSTEHCQIHEQWLYLLHRYLSDEVTTRSYIEDSLALLRQYKDRYRQRLMSISEGASKTKKPKTEKNKDKNKKKKKKKKKKGKKKK